jgi:hypothetical protein
MDQKVLSFNAFKHHLQFVQQIVNCLSERESDKKLFSILDEIKQIGNNVLDLYIGEMTIQEIFTEILVQLKSYQVINQSDFIKWLNPLGYKTFELSDNSIWILRYGKKDVAYMHIHPARYGKHVIRITGSAWKTAFAVALFKYKIPGELKMLVDRTNYARINFLEMSPVKKIIAGSNLDIALKLLNNL